VLQLIDYYREIQATAQVNFVGKGLETAIRHRLDHLVGILEEQPGLVFSPWIKLFNDIIPEDGALDADCHGLFRRCVFGWLGIGSSWLIVEALGLFWADAPAQAASQADEIEQRFFLGAEELIRGFVDYLDQCGAEGRRLAAEIHRTRERLAGSRDSSVT
jgi:hypothetical protein